MQLRAISGTPDGGLAIEADAGLTDQTSRNPAPRNMFSQTLQTVAHSTRLWINLEFTRVIQRAEDFVSFRLPVYGEPIQPPADAPARPADERIAPTAIVLLGLAEVIFVAFLVGQTYGTLHPVWKVIVTLAACGFAGFSVRLLRLLKRCR